MTKKILLILTVFFIAVSQNCAYAQYALETQSEGVQELLYQQNNVSVEFGKGVQMVDTGKTLIFTGTAVALTGLACYIGGAAMYDPNPDAPDMPMYPLFAIAGAAAGGLIAMVGLPFYLYGNTKMETYGSSHFTFGNQDQEGISGFFEMGLGIPNFFSMDAIGGYNFGNNFFMGAGLGFKTYLTNGLRYDGATACLPIYTNFRYSVGNKRIAPYVGASVGYDMANTGLYSAVEFGTRIRKIGGQRGTSWWLGAKTDFIPAEENMFISLKIGRSF